jgi:aspartate racemase
LSAIAALPRLGVLGGMGPLATADFLRKLTEATPAERDQEHLPVIVYSVPQIPDRVAPILGSGGESPLPAMIEGVRTLEAAGAESIVIPCITAHHWYDELCRTARVPIIHIADATCNTLRERHVDGAVGLLATRATLHSGFFQTRLERCGYHVALPTEEEMQRFVLPAITCVKRNDITGALALAIQAVEGVLRRGAAAVVLACSELPLALETADFALAARCVDTLAALARCCVAWARLPAATDKHL